ncbi:MAG: nucleotidyltransferase family protein [Rhodospirillaceae bacterium]|nr:nucleotidyltransferase family protein [Rhodospirillaceae bacterium]
MNRDQIIQTFKTHETALRRRGVRRASLFGSVARGEARPGSDIDIFVELDPAAKMTAFDYADVVNYIQSLFSEPVDVSNREMLKPHVRPSAERDAVSIF